MQKQCVTCSISKDLELFSRKGSKHQSRCKECTRKYDKEYYQKNIDKRKQRKRETSRIIRTRNSQYIYEYLRCHPCVDCGISNPLVLEFDHVSGDKLYNISEMSSLSLTKIIDEINKCLVRCANCHRIKTAIQLGWYKYLDTQRDIF